MKNWKTTIAVLLLAFAAGTLVGNQTSRVMDRPFLRALAGAARLGLKLLVFEPPPPRDCPVVQHDPDAIDHYGSL